MLGWILAGIAMLAVGVIVISGMITKDRLREQLKSRNLKSAFVKSIDRCTNTVKLEDLYSDETLEIQGDDVDSELRLHQRITV